MSGMDTRCNRQAILLALMTKTVLTTTKEFFQPLLIVYLVAFLDTYNGHNVMTLTQRNPEIPIECQLPSARSTDGVCCHNLKLKLTVEFSTAAFYPAEFQNGSEAAHRKGNYRNKMGKNHGVHQVTFDVAAASSLRDCIQMYPFVCFVKIEKWCLNSLPALDLFCYRLYLNFDLQQSFR